MTEIENAFRSMQARGDMEFDEGDQWSEQDISAFETATELKMPHQLRDFLLTYGFLGAEINNAFSVTLEGGGMTHLEMLSVGKLSSERMIEETTAFLEKRYGEDLEKLQPGRITPGYIFMGLAEGGRSHLLMDGLNPDNNAIYIWGLAYDPWGEGDNTLGIGYVAPSLAEFLRDLRPMTDFA